MIINQFGLDQNEEVFDDFKCTLRTSAATNQVTDFVGTRISAMIEQMGHMYLTEDHICFCGQLFGETKFKLRFIDIKSIAKTKTLGIIDWAIIIKTTIPGKEPEGQPEQSEEYIFGAFQNRDQAYKRMMDLWVTHVPYAAGA